MLEALLSAWGNFYVIIGSSAAALTGLTFVVIALAADARRLTPRGLRAFVTPTIVHFGTVLALAVHRHPQRLGCRRRTHDGTRPLRCAPRVVLAAPRG